MGYPVTLALRYLGSKKRASISVGSAFAVLGVALGVAALLTVMSVTGGFQAQFREKVLGVNAHVLVLKHSTEFRNYREIMERSAKVPRVLNVAPFSINPMMLTHGERSATGVLVKGVDPQASLGVGLDPSTPPVLDLPRHIVRGEKGECPTPSTLACGIAQLEGLRRPNATPPERRGSLRSPEPPPEPSLEPELDAPSPPSSAEPSEGMPPWLKEALEKKERQRALAPAPSASAPSLPPDAPKGEVTPDGGYKSVLPDDDDVPADLTRDPCADPALTKNLPGIVIGTSLADSLRLGLGDCVTVTSPTIGFSFSSGAIKPPVAKQFRVMAMFEAGFDQYDSKLVYTDLYEAQSFYDEGDTVTGVEMKIDDIDASGAVVAGLNAALPTGAYRVMDWKELNHGLFTALLIQQIGMSAVLALIILVAAFTVVATLIMVVLDKKKEISVLKAMGATNSAILRVFLYQGGIIGGIGTLGGLGVGYLVCKSLVVWAFPLDPKVYFISHLPVLMRWQEFAVTGGVAVALCLLATVLPSLYAAGIRPAEGFREQ
jgi:lipoprotein-releasing system permease protein